MIAAVQPLFGGFKLVRNSQVPLQARDLPVLGVYLLPERTTPDGDLDGGTIRFVHQFGIGFSVVIANNDPDVAEQKLDAAWWSLMNGLWRNAGLTNLINSSNADNTRLEGISLGVRRFMYGALGANQETPIAELQYEVTGQYRSDWVPIITDDFVEMVETVIPSGYDPTQTEPVDVRYEFTTQRSGE